MRKNNLAGEAIHLIHACQLAGFRHAIGVLWEASDQHCAEVARVVYETLKRKGLADEAVDPRLQRATRRICDNCRNTIMRNGAEDESRVEQSTED